MNCLLTQRVGRWYTGFSIITLLYALLNGCVAQKQPEKGPTKKAPHYTVLQEKLDSHLLDLLATYKQRSTTADTTTVPIPTTGGRPGDIAIDIRATVTDSLLENIRKLGGTIIYPSKQFQTIRATIPVLQLETLAYYKAVIFIATAAKATTNPQRSLPTL
jgi:hypothetical protein